MITSHVLRKRLSKAAEIEFMTFGGRNGPICVAVLLQDSFKMDISSECRRSYESSINQELQCSKARICEIGTRCWRSKTSFFNDAIGQLI